MRELDTPVSHDSDPLIKALRDMPVPEPRPGFVDRALRNATQVTTSADVRPESAANRWARVATRWETWFGAALGGAVAAILTIVLMRPSVPDRLEPMIVLSLNEARDIQVLIDSDRDLTDATIRIAATGDSVQGLAEYQNVNVDKLVHRRFELSGETKIVRGFSVGADWSYLDAENEEDGSAVGEG